MLGALQRQCCSRVGAAAAVGVGLGVSAGLAGFRSAAGPAQCDAAEQQSPSLGRTEVHELAQGLQQQFVLRLEALATADGIDSAGDFHPVSWLRDEGRHGGGTRYELQNTPLFNRASVNVSSVHYADMPKYPVKSATALSMILHPSNPHAPSMHLHVSYMEPNGRPPYWRMIADLNPSIEDPAATERFEAAMRAAMPATLYADSKLFGDRYFYIPDLDRHRGAAHVFVGALGAGDIAGMSTGQCAALAERFASSALETYCAIVQEALDTHEESAITAEDRATQLAYHTLYFFQVLTLDRGTTHGVLAHNQNDVGTLGSLPSRIDPELLAAWGREKVAAPRDELVAALLAALPVDGSGVVSTETRQALAGVLRKYYRADRTRLAHQASLDLGWWASRDESMDSAVVGGAAAGAIWSTPGGWR